MMQPKQYFDSGEYNMNKAKGLNYSNKQTLEPAYAGFLQIFLIIK